MKNSPITSIPFASQEISSEKQESFSFETMKQDFLSIIDDLLKIYEKSFFSYENMLKIIQAYNEWNNFIKTINYTLEIKNIENKINWEIKLFISEYKEYFNIDLFRTIFNNAYWLKNEWTNNTKIIKEYISAQIALEKEDKRTRWVKWKKINSIYNIESENNKCKSDINKLLWYDENLFWYTIFKIYKQKIDEIKDLSHLPYWIEILQKTPIFKDTITKTEIYNYLFKYKNQISTEMLFWLICSDKWEETLKEILDNPENTTQKMDICLFIMEYEKDKYALQMPKIFESCITCMKDKIWSSYSNDWTWCNIRDLIRIYQYYKENKVKINPELDVEWTFEIYSELYTPEDFYHDRNLLYTWELPVTYVKIAFSWCIEMIMNMKNLDDVDCCLQQNWIINVFFENNFCLLDEINQIKEKIYELKSEISSDYINKFSSIIRRILYWELNLRLYWDDKKIYNLHLLNIRKAKNELDLIGKELIWNSNTELDNQDSEYVVLWCEDLNLELKALENPSDDWEEVPF